MLSEFDLIKRYFRRDRASGLNTVLGIGDDCALLSPTPGKVLAVSSDMLVEDRHFFAGADPFTLGHKCLAVNLSDLAAMGAAPLGFTLALALAGWTPFRAACSRSPTRTAANWWAATRPRAR
jgi:thiamine-monophosphate kinase